jgi:hypothetical protein
MRNGHFNILYKNAQHENGAAGHHEISLRKVRAQLPQ